METHMLYSSIYPSKYWKAADVESGPRILQIDGLEMERMGDGETKPVLYFHHETKGLVLNKSNGNVLADLFGDDTDDWAGKRIEMFSVPTEYGGRSVQGLRLREPVIAGKGKKAPPAKRADGDDLGLDDDIPF
jgi:hypothetical protein